jgi:hypothetical protein
MAKPNPKILAMVRREVQKNPDISNSVLLDKAVSIDRSLRKLNARQFHGTYRLTVARELAPPKRRARKKKPEIAARPSGRDGRRAEPQRVAAPPKQSRSEANSAHTAVRSILLNFAKEIATAETKTDLVNALASIDGYVTRVIAASR